MILEVTKNNLDNVLDNGGLTLIDFYAEWCEPCKQLMPVIEKISGDYTNNSKVTICKVNVDDESEVAVRYGIRGIPTLLFIKNGQVVDKLVRLVSEVEIKNTIDKLI
jgi:thioredoxin